MKRIVFLAAAWTVALWGPVQAAAGAQDARDQTRQTLQEALREYRRALAAANEDERRQRLDQAFVLFQQVFQSNPSSEVVHAWMEFVGQQEIASMMNSSDRRFQDIGRMLFELAQPGVAIRRDRTQIQRYVQQLQDSRTEVWQQAFWHLKNIGPYAMRDLLPLLGETTQDTLRARVILLMTEMRWDATLPLVAALKSRNPMLRLNAAIVLGHIRDERALPYLKAIVEDPNEPPELVERAHEAVARITGLHPLQWRPAEEYFLRLAEKYYYSHPDVVHDFQPNDLIWSWDTQQDRLIEREVPRFAFNEQAAEEVLYDWLARAPEHAAAWGLLAAVHFAQRVEARIALDAAEEAVRRGDATNDDVQKIRQLLADVERASVLGAAAGRPYVYLALARSLRDGRVEVAVECIEALARMAQPDDLPNAAPQADPSAFGTPLAEALAHEDKRVRYHAAFAWARLNPQQVKIGMELVMPNLIDALGEQGVRVALVSHPARNQRDWEVINELRRLLEGVGAFPVLATDPSEALARARAFPTEDVIFLDFGLATRVVFQEETATRGRVVENVFQSLAQDLRTRATKFVIICHDDAELNQARAIFGQASPRAADGYVLPGMTRIQMRELFQTLFAGQGTDAKTYADELARRAAEALASLDTQNTYFPYLSAVEALMEAASSEGGRPDAVRIPSLRALGRFGDPRGLEVLGAVLADGGASREVRLAAAEALADHFARSNAAPSDTVFTAMRDAMLGSDHEIRLAVGRAFGAARLTPEQRRELQRAGRIPRPENP